MNGSEYAFTQLRQGSKRKDARTTRSAKILTPPPVLRSFGFFFSAFLLVGIRHSPAAGAGDDQERQQEQQHDDHPADGRLRSAALGQDERGQELGGEQGQMRHGAEITLNVGKP